MNKNKNGRNKGKFYIREIFNEEIQEEEKNEAMQSETEYAEKMKVKIREREKFCSQNWRKKKIKDCRSYTWQITREMSIEVTGTSLLCFA